ncbi:MAG: hypothetical protein WC889_15220 [Myxococcota bacterium]
MKSNIWVLAGLVLLAPFHMALETHRWCPEHGEYEHGDSSALLLSRHRELPAFSIKNIKAQGEEHHHACQLLGVLLRAAALNPICVSPHVPALQPDKIHYAFSDSFHGMAVVDAAPKTSPPSALVC